MMIKIYMVVKIFLKAKTNAFFGLKDQYVGENISKQTV